jgi:tetratricopeptide (TPR) repeat protein
VAQTLNNMAIVRKALGEHQEALQLYDRALKIREATYGPQHSSVGDTLYNMAVLRKSLGEMAEAKALYLRCEQIYAAVYGADHSETVDARKRAAACD